ncbi:VOC family protein [Pandoraea communis]|uniref:VOC family protein n=1 Tax=Pandoraea communis TaxID=2508297 RepID=A0A5E4VEZ3_9BURK|nr:VOC family protein [Pandoraea communis]
MLRVYTADAVLRMPLTCCAAAGQWQGALDTLQRWVDGVK